MFVMATQQTSDIFIVFVMATQQQVIFISVCYGYSTTSDIYYCLLWLLNNKWYLLVFVMATQQQMIFISVCYGYSTTSDIY